MLRDDPRVQWPDAVMPGTVAARVLLAESKAREAEIDARRDAAEAARRAAED